MLDLLKCDNLHLSARNARVAKSIFKTVITCKPLEIVEQEGFSQDHVVTR